ncbi:MAG: hypothetical protein ABIY55_26120, partial [Kofleriaceae bacterium]
MSAVPAEIAGIGSTQQKLRVSPGFDPLKAAVGPQEYFVLSRIDGMQTLREVLLTTGLPVDRAITIVQRLRAIGALLIPGETGSPVAAPTPPSRPTAPSSTAATPGRAPAPPIAVSQGTGPSPVVRPSAPAAAQPTPQNPVTGLRRAANNQPTAPETSDPEPEHDLTLPDPTPVELAALREDTVLDD